MNNCKLCEDCIFSVPYENDNTDEIFKVKCCFYSKAASCGIGLPRWSNSFYALEVMVSKYDALKCDAFHEK